MDVSVNGSRLARQATAVAFDAAHSGWYVDGGLIAVKSGALDVLQRKVFEVILTAVSDAAASELSSSAH